MSIRIKALNNGSIHPTIKQVFEPLRQVKGIQVFLHGSWADNSTTAFSDIDDFIIVDDINLKHEEIEKVESVLKQIENKFYKIDPLQHHGHWKVYKSELQDYNNGIIPLFILEDAICIQGSNLIEASINHYKTYYTISNSISNFCKCIDELFTDYFNNQINVHNLKRLVGSVVLLAPLLQQLRNNNIDKRTAILNANKLFSNDALNLIHWASNLRSNWHLLTESKAFASFVSKQSEVPLEEWQRYSENNAPIIDSSDLSVIKPDIELVQNFIQECIQHLDASTLIQKNVEDYNKAYKLVEEYAIEQNAIAVGQFGETKHPGISDLDVFICFKDQYYKKGQEDIRLFIEHNKELCYVFTHPPICVAESMLKHLPYVHTINNLKLNYKQKELDLNTKLSQSYIKTLNILWTLFILSGLDHEVTVANKSSLRSLLLRLKNAHTSEDNLNAMLNIDSNAVSYSNTLRADVFTSYKSTRRKVEKAILEVYQTLATSRGLKSKNYCIVGRKLILKQGNYSTERNGQITIYTLPPELYNMLKAYFYRTNKDLQLYLKAYKTIEDKANKLKGEIPAVFLLRQYIDIELPSTKKKIIFSLLSLLPFSLVNKLFN